MNRLALPLVLMLASPAAAFTPDRAGLMVDAVRANGCVLDSADAERILSPLGLEGMEVQSFIDILFSAGLVALLENNTILSLPEPLCSIAPEASMAIIEEAFAAQAPELTPWTPTFTPERGAQLVGVVRAEGCTLSDARAGEVLPPLAFTPVEARDIVSTLVEMEHAGVAEDGSSMVLSDALCAADPAGDVAFVEAMIVAWFEANPTDEPAPADQ